VSHPIVVIGSINMDLVARAPRLPRAGETVLGEDLLRIPGGKGANQAVAAARLGAEVHMVGRVGDDEFGRELITGLLENGVGTELVSRTHGVATGCASILVSRAGENCIVVSPGANARVTPDDVDAAEALIGSAGVVVLQLEIPIATVRHVVKLCRRLGVKTILDPAPVPPGGLPADLYRVDVLTPNEQEARRLNRSALRQAGMVVRKLGPRGCIATTRDKVVTRGVGFKVEALDTTAAGDAFAGALAVAMSRGMPLPEALGFANAAGAVCCTRVGAQPSLPTRAEVEKLKNAGPAKARTPRPRRAGRRPRPA
jgi:ribokinase